MAANRGLGWLGAIGLALLLLALAACSASDRHRVNDAGLPLERSGAGALDPGTVSEIESYRPAVQVSPKLLEMLKARLIEELAANRGNEDKKTSATSPLAGLRVTEFTDTVHFSWRYPLSGDYDLNGEVAVADITPVALNYLAVIGDGQSDLFESFIDGDGNNEIGVSDITPIAVNYLDRYDVSLAIFSAAPSAAWSLGDWRANAMFETDASVAGASGAAPLTMERSTLSADYGRISLAVDEAANGLGPGAYFLGVRSLGEPPGFVGFAAFNLGPLPPDIDSVSPTTGEAGTQITIEAALLAGDPPLTFAWDFGGGASPDQSPDESPQVTLSDTPGQYAASVTVTNSMGSDTYDFALEVTPSTNQPPIAGLTADVTDGTAPMLVNFDAGGSVDPEGGALAFEWDWNGDGTWDYDSGQTATAAHTYLAAGTFDAAVRVTDIRGDSAAASVQITVAGGGAPFWHIYLVDGAGQTGFSPSLAVIHGKPAIAYMQSDVYQLRYVRAGDAFGDTWEAPVTLETGGGDWNSLMTVNGNPAVSYYHRDTGSLNYIRATDADGAAWDTPQIVVPGGDLGEFNSMEIVAGNPAVCFWINGGGGLGYVRAADPSGDSWNAPVYADSTSGAGKFASLAVVNGMPSISYIVSDSPGAPGPIRFVRALDPDGQIWGVPVEIDDSAEGTVNATSLKIVDGRPALTYMDYTPYALNYVRANDADGSSWPVPVSIDGGGGEAVGIFPSMEILNGNPAVVYHIQDTRDLLMIRANDADGASWGSRETVDSTDETGLFPSFKMVNGLPGIAYMNLTNFDLMFAIYY